MRAPFRSRPPRLAARVAVAVIVLAALSTSASCNQANEIRTQALQDSRAVTFTTSDGVRLAGRLFGPDTATAGVVLAHMLPSDQSSWFDFADRLSREGYRVLTFDFRGYCPGGDAGCSRGQKDVASIWKDVLAAEARIGGDLRHLSPERHIAVVGPDDRTAEGGNVALGHVDLRVDGQC